MSGPLVLIVDDEPDILALLEITLSRMGLQTRPADTLAAAYRLLSQYRFDLCLTDMRLPDGDGIELVRHVNQHQPQLPIAVITAHGSMETAIEALKAGAFDFLSKPVDLEGLRVLVASALKLEEKRAGGGDQPERAMLGESSAAQETRRMIRKLARTQAPVFICGESGTGKELAARLIHALGPRSDGAFVPVNCGAIPQELMESELFGHRKGSFTGAIGDRQGLFQVANGGTLFLDEVADLPFHMQVKLLRAIQERSVRPVGAQQETPVDVRILSASHKELEQLVSAGEFRQDLFYRLNVIQLRMPPLRERPGDIPELARHLLERICSRSGLAPKQLTDSALQAMKAYDFPGNVRELENTLERALALADGDRIVAADLQLPSSSPRAPDAPAAPAPPDNLPLEDYLADVERAAILQALERTRWNRTAAAKKLGITLRVLRYKLAKLGLDGPKEQESDAE
jgi:two-component system response regulator PilR (NtrC family)